MVAADGLVVTAFPELFQASRLNRDCHRFIRHKGVDRFRAAVFIIDLRAENQDKVVGRVDPLIRLRQETQAAVITVRLRLCCFTNDQVNLRGNIADRDGHIGLAVLRFQFLPDGSGPVTAWAVSFLKAAGSIGRVLRRRSLLLCGDICGQRFLLVFDDRLHSVV